MKNNPSCPFCGNDETFAARTGLSVFGTWKNAAFTDSEKYFCGRCETAFVYPIPDSSALSRFYETQYRDSLTIGSDSRSISLPIEMAFSEKSFLRAQNLFDLMRQNNMGFPSGSSHLDVGGYQGLFAWAVSRLFNTSATVSDFSKEGLEFAEKYLGIRTIEQAHLFDMDEKFDLISLVQVLEHVTRPEEYLLEIKSQILARNGILYIEVPNILSFPLSDPAHLYDFSTGSLSSLLEKVGFRVLAVKVHGFPNLPSLPKINHTISVLAMESKMKAGDLPAPTNRETETKISELRFRVNHISKEIILSGNEIGSALVMILIALGRVFFSTIAFFAPSFASSWLHSLKARFGR